MSQHLKMPTVSDRNSESALRTGTGNRAELDSVREPLNPGSKSGKQIAVVIPCFRVAQHLPAVLGEIGADVSMIYCVIDGCPEGSAAVAQTAADRDPRIRVMQHEMNLGVGGACMTGIRQALKDGAEIIVKLDGDGQMSPHDIPYLIEPIVTGRADYAKGNRFSNIEDVQGMPWPRILGNAGLSFMAKLSTGYWNIFDPTNGFTAMDAAVARRVPWHKLNTGYFFESDLLFRLNTIRAIVVDRPMKAFYGSEKSNLNAFHSLLLFPLLHARNFFKRIGYNYFLRDFNMASLNLIVGSILWMFGTIFGTIHWWRSIENDAFASSGTVMLAALPIILGWQALLAFFAFDVSNVPQTR